MSWMLGILKKGTVGDCSVPEIDGSGLDQRSNNSSLEITKRYFTQYMCVVHIVLHVDAQSRALALSMYVFFLKKWHQSGIGQDVGFQKKHYLNLFLFYYIYTI